MPNIPTLQAIITRKLSLSGRPPDQPIGILSYDETGHPKWTPIPKESTDYTPLRKPSKEEKAESKRSERKRIMQIGAVPGMMGDSANFAIRGPAFEGSAAAAARKHGAVEVLTRDELGREVYVAEGELERMRKDGGVRS